MRTTIDCDGRIVLGKEVQAQLGVQPGDDVILENHGHEWVIKAARSPVGLHLEGNVLVHGGTLAPASADPLASGRDERMDQLIQGIPR